MKALKKLLSGITVIMVALSCMQFSFFITANADSDFVIASVEQTDDMAKTVTVYFTESVSYEYAEDTVVLIATETGEDIILDNISLRADKIVITLSEVLSANTEYCVILPDGIKGVSGKTLYKNRIYFVVELSVLNMPEMGETVFYRNYEGLQLGNCTNTTIWNQHIAVSDTTGISCVEALQADGEYGKVIKYEEPGSSKIIRLEGADANNRWCDTAEHDRIIFSFDYCRPEIVTTGIFNVTVTNPGTKNANQFYFDGWGNLIISNKTEGSISIWDDSYTGGKNYPSDVIAYEAGIEANEWNTVTIVMDKKAQTFTYYFDGDYVGTVPCLKGANNPKIFQGFRISSTRPGVVHYFDNNTVGYPAAGENKISTFRMTDEKGNVYGPKENNASVIMKRAELKFSSDIDMSTISVDTVKITDGENDIPWSNPVFDSNDYTLTFDITDMLKKDTKYYVIADGVYDAGHSLMPAYKSDFTTTAVGELSIEALEYYDAKNNLISDISQLTPDEEVTLRVHIVSTYDEPIGVKVSISSYSDNVLSDSKIAAFDAAGMADTFQELTVKAGSLINGEIVSAITDQNSRPLCDSFVLGGNDFTKDEWTIEFADKTEKNSKIYAEVSAPEGSASDIVYRGQITADGGGDFNVRFKLYDNPETENDAISGYYILTWFDEFGASGTKRILFANQNELSKAVGDIIEIVAESTSSTKEQDIKTIALMLDDNRYSLSADSEYYDSNNKILMASMLYEYIKTNHTFTTDTVNLITRIASVEAGTTENLFDYDDILHIGTSRIKDFYKKYYVTKLMQKKITSSLKSGGYKAIDDFYEALTEKFVLAAVAEPDGLTNVKELIREFSAEIGTGSSGSEKAYKAVMNNSYESYGALKNAFDAAEKAEGSSDGSSGRGSGGIVKDRVTVSTDIQAANTSGASQQMHYDIFTDLDGADWAKDAIVCLAEKKIVSGKSDYLYCPNDFVTRQEACKMLVLAFGYADTGSEYFRFEDVDDWARSYVETAYANGIVNGYSDCAFGGKDRITRQDMAVMIYRSAVYAGAEFITENSGNEFIDSTGISDYAKEAISTLYNCGYINGIGHNTFAPSANATRAEIAQIIYNVIKK